MITQLSCERLPFADNSIDLIFTDPPYLRDLLPCYEWLANEAARVLKPGGFLLAMCGGNYINKIFRYFDDSGLDYYWKYENGMTGGTAGVVWKHSPDGDKKKHKPISVRSKSIIAYSKGHALSRTGTCGWYEGNGKDKIYHEWGQDVESARYYIDCFTAPDDLVCDPFLGGGTTAEACRVIGRRFIGGDIDPKALTTTAARLRGEEPIKVMLPLETLRADDPRQLTLFRANGSEAHR